MVSATLMWLWHLYWDLSPWALLLLAGVQVARFLRLLAELGGTQRDGRYYDLVDGYELEVSWQWHELTEAQRNAMVNGIGAECWPPELRELLNGATGFCAPSRPHDVDYNVYRTKDERRMADCRLFRNCIRVLLQDASGWRNLAGLLLTDRPRVRRLWHRLLIARAIYRCVRVGGLPAFNAASKVDFIVRGGTVPAAPLIESNGADYT
jgi:hypothetical protein